MPQGIEFIPSPKTAETTFAFSSVCILLQWFVEPIWRMVPLQLSMVSPPPLSMVSPGGISCNPNVRIIRESNKYRTDRPTADRVEEEVGKKEKSSRKGVLKWKKLKKADKNKHKITRNVMEHGSFESKNTRR